MLEASFNNEQTLDDQECINAIFESKISHEGWPWGLTKNHLTISKDKCLIVIRHEKLKFLKRKWAIDVCRGPVHIKYGVHSVDVLKRMMNCFGAAEENDEFCHKLNDLKKILQDDGLIFAKGEKEDLSSDHGKAYCSYLLIQTYLEDGIVLNRKKKYKKILETREHTATKGDVEEKSSKGNINIKKTGSNTDTNSSIDADKGNKTGDF